MTEDDEHDETLCLTCTLRDAVIGWMDRAEASGDPDRMEEANDTAYHLSIFTDMMARLLVDLPPDALEKAVEIIVRNLRKYVAQHQASDETERPPGTALQ